MVQDFNKNYNRITNEVKTTALTGRLALIPASRRRLRTVWSEILRCPGIAAAVDVAVVNLSRK
jgi:hypothetical protein